MRIPQLARYRGRNPKGYFQDLPWDVRIRAHKWLNHFMRRWGSDMPRWRFAILVGQAKRLALMSTEQRSKWGRTMLAKRGGHAVQRRYLTEGRGPTAYATMTRVCKQKAGKRAAEQAMERKRLGLPAPPRVWSGNMEGI
jgi:hypothetical protein